MYFTSVMCVASGNNGAAVVSAGTVNCCGRGQDHTGRHGTGSECALIGLHGISVLRDEVKDNPVRGIVLKICHHLDTVDVVLTLEVEVTVTGHVHIDKDIVFSARPEMVVLPVEFSGAHVINLDAAAGRCL